MADNDYIKRLQDRLQFEEARADLMFECDCKLYYHNIKWALDYIKDNELTEYNSYHNAKEYLLKALKPMFDELENSDLNTRESIKEHIQSDGLFQAIANKMIADASKDLEDIKIYFDELNIHFTASETTIYFSDLDEDEKEKMIESFKESSHPHKEALLEKHKSLLKEIDLYDAYKQTMKDSNEISDMQRNHRINRR